MLIHSWSLWDSGMWEGISLAAPHTQGQSRPNAAHPRVPADPTQFSCSSPSAVCASEAATAPQPLLGLLSLPTE